MVHFACAVVKQVPVFGGSHTAQEGVADMALDGIGFLAEVPRERTRAASVSR